MARWEPDAAGRLAEAAMQLFRERGFDRTTVADIAARAGLTERTFFRYFADKREVLFSGGPMLQDFVVERVAQAPAGMPPIDVVANAIAATGELFEPRRDFARQRQALITTHAELRERELIKLAKMAAAVAEALRRRGVSAPAASLAAEAGIAIFKRAFEAWVEEDGKKRDLDHHVRAAHAELEGVVAGTQRAEPATQKGAAPKGAPPKATMQKAATQKAAARAKGR
jgi:AcrR family transcriptional regulator